MGFFRDLSESRIPEEAPGIDQEQANENAGDKEETGMSDFEDANVDKDILSQIFGDDVSGDSQGASAREDLFADSAAEEDKKENFVQTEIPDLILTDDEPKEEKEDASSEDAGESGEPEPKELSVDEILKAATEEEAPAKDAAAKEDASSKKPEWKAAQVDDIPDDDVTVITKGTTINGGISSDGSLEIMGTITGDVECLGRVSVYGTISGNVSASDVVIKTKRLEGNITSDGSVEVAVGTIVIGDITGTSATVAGAVKGNIDVNGPVVVDSTAIVKGSIKAKSIQVNTGAVVDGYCSLNYAGVDLEEFFEEK